MICGGIAFATYAIVVVINQLVIHELMKCRRSPAPLYLKRNMEAVREAALVFKTHHGRLPSTNHEITAFLSTPSKTDLLINPYTSNRESPAFLTLHSWQSIQSKLKIGQVAYVDTGSASFSVAALGDSGFLVWADKDQFASVLALEETSGVRNVSPR